MANRAQDDCSLDEHIANSTRLLRKAVRDAVSAHYKAGQPVVYQRGNKIYERTKPGTKGRVIATVGDKPENG